MPNYEYKSYEQDSVSLTPQSPFFFDHVSRYWWASGFAQGKTVLDCACGKGYGAYILSKAAAQVCGVDLNKSSLDIARRNFEKENLKFTEHDILKLGELNQKFDVITAFEIIEHIPPETTESFLLSLGSALEPEGLLLLSTPNHDVVLKSGVSVPEFHINNLRAEELRKILEKHFSEVTMLGQYQQRHGLAQRMFDFDFLNMRHVLGKPVRRVLDQIRRPKPSTQSTQAKPAVVYEIERRHFELPPPEVDAYRFSKAHWRQSGMSVAMCRFPRV